MHRLLVVTLSTFLFGGTALADAIPISDLQRGQSATVEGVIDRFFDMDEIELRDETGTVRVYLGPQTLPIQSGERVAIEGVMDDDLFMNEFYARQITRENGDIIEISGEYE